jgi:hypothetical protein
MTDKNYSKPVPYSENVERSRVCLGECKPLPLINRFKNQLTSNLFLYVDCVQEWEAYKRGYRTLIKFLTNVIIEKNRKGKNNGCLFTISLPGKAF